MKIRNKFTVAYFVLIALFFLSQLFTLGTFNAGGESVEYASGKTLVYNVEYASDSEKLGEVYAKIGSVYADYGENATVTVKYSLTSSSSSFTNLTDTGVKFANVYSKEGLSGKNYNWVRVATNTDEKAVKRIAFSADKNLQLIELVAFSDIGKPVTLTAYVGTAVEGSLSAATAKKAIDAQDSYTAELSARANLSQEEAYTLTAAHTLLSGNKTVEGSRYNLTDQNFLATILVAPSVALFGESAFAVRFPSLIATTAILALVGLLGTALFKDEKYGFIFSLVFAIGGMATSVGRLGAPYAILACLLLASLYFMHRFYSKGIGSRVLKGGVNVLLSGVFAATALAIDWTAIFPVLGVLVLFGFGLKRQKTAYELALAECEAEEETRTLEDGTEITVNLAARKAERLYQYKTKVSVGFAALGFAICTFLLLLVSGVIAYSAAVKAYDNPRDPSMSFVTLIFKGLAASGNATRVTSFSAANASSVFAWFLPWKAATLYTGGATGEYLAWSVAANPVLSLLSFGCLIGMTVKIVKDFVKKNADKKALRLRRAYFVLVGGMLLTTLAAAIRGNVSALSSFAFSIFYVGLIPLALVALSDFGKAKKAELAFTVLIAVAFAVFAIAIPSAYGFAVSTTQAKLFGWTSFVSNGYFR